MYWYISVLQVNFFKPKTSKGGNSECYLVCRFFQGVSESCLAELESHYGADKLQRSVWPIEKIPTAFFKHLHEITELFTNAQICAINVNVDSFASGKCASKQAKQKAAREWAHKMKLKKLPKEQYQGYPVRIPWACNNYRPRLEGQFDERTANSRVYLMSMFLKRLEEAESDRRRLEAYKYGLPVSVGLTGFLDTVSIFGPCFVVHQVYARILSSLFRTYHFCCRNQSVLLRLLY